MTIRRRSVVLSAALAGAVLSAWLLAADREAALHPSDPTTSRAEPVACVAAVIPEAYYQAIAELTTCTGRGVAAEVPPADLPWRTAAQFPLPGAERRVVLNP